MAFAAPAGASAASPQVTSTSVFEVAETSATLRGKIDAAAAKTEYHFEYITLAAYEAAGESFGEGTVNIPSPEPTLPGHPEVSGDLTSGSNAVTHLTVLKGALEVGQAITGTGIPAETTITAFDLGKGTLALSKAATATASGVKLLTTGPQPVSTPVTGLAPGTAYRVRISAHHGAETPVHGQTVAFAALASAPVFGPCPNDPFRTGAFAPPGQPSALLPDCRAYEQVSPVEKDGTDAVGEPDALGAAPDGQAITFHSSFGMPGGEGSQTYPPFLATRSGTGWSSVGLLPPAAVGSVAYLLGRTADFAYSITEARRLDPQGVTYESALFLRKGASGPPRQIVGYQPSGLAQSYFYVGASADDHEILFESFLALPPTESAPPLEGAVQGSSNVYVYDTQTGVLSLAARMNSAEQTEVLLHHGAFAGPYDWALGSGAFQLSRGGTRSASYTQDDHVVSEGGDLFFTAAGSGQLYERVNPTEPQSQMEGGRCLEPDKACTYHVSATHKTNSPETEDGSDPAGPQPAAFMAASTDGTTAFFTSSEKLTDDANTGPEVSPAQIGRAKPGEEEAEEVDESFLPAHALGMATSPDGHYLYWANPAGHSIGRADLTAPDPAATAEPEFLVPEETEAENFPEKEPGVLHSAPTAPRYVALGPCAEGGECLYWTNTGPLGSLSKKSEGEEPVDGAGTIGRAELDASGNLVPEGVDPEFIAGKVENGSGKLENAVSNPQGIAVNSSHIYWANDSQDQVRRAIARAAIGGGAVEPGFWTLEDDIPDGLVLSGGHVYFAKERSLGAGGHIARIGLEGGDEEQFFIRQTSRVRGIAVSGPYVYWADQSEEAIGRAGLGEFEPGACEIDESAPGHSILGCKRHYLRVEGSPFGLVTDPSGQHIYWSVNGEAPTNPGTDLYRFQRPGTGSCEESAGCLTDLSADPTGDGAEALGVLGASEDGSRLYFVANGALVEGASRGDCHSQVPHDDMRELSGHCNLYLAEEGGLRFIARLKVPSGQWPLGADKFDWVPSPNLSSGAHFDFKYPRQADVSRDGRVLSFLSSEPLTAYGSSGSCDFDESIIPLEPCPEFYRFDAATDQLTCLTCNPSGIPPTAAPTLLRYATPFSGRPGGSAEAASVLARNLTDEGDRFFFQSTEALVGSDVDGIGGCPKVSLGGFSYPACQDVYEWEAPGTGSCSEASSSYSAQDEGCIYLLSPGNDARPALFADADESGENAFFFTRDQLVGQDEDQLFDLYDARTEGGLASQNEPPPAEACSGEACKPGATAPPATSSPTTPNFRGEGNVKQPQRPKCPKGRRLVRSKGHARCVEKHRSQRRKHHRHSKEARR